MTTESHARPTIGDILLAHGFVSSDDIASAIEEQARTQQPLGQILVTRGVLTRLELASALAEQWAMPVEPGPATRAPLEAQPLPAALVVDDDTYAMRVQAAVSDLARRVGAAEPLLAEIERRAAESISPEELDARLASVRARVEQADLRLAGLDSSVSALAAQLDELAGGIEGALTEISAGTGELADRLDAVAGRESGDTELTERVDDVAARMDGVAERLETEMRETEALRAQLRDLAERPVGDPHLAEGLREDASALGQRLDEGLAQLARMDDIRGEIRALAERVEDDRGLPGRIDELGERIAAALRETAGLSARVDELASRPVDGDPALSHDLRRRMDELAGSMQGGSSEIERLRGETAALASASAAWGALQACVEDIATQVGTAHEATGRLTAHVHEIAERSATDQSVTDRLHERADELEGRLDHGLAHTEARLRDEIGSAEARATSQHVPAIRALETRVDDVEARPEVDAGLALRLDVLASEIEALRPTAPDAQRIHARLDDLAGRLAELSEQHASGDELARRVDELGGRIDALAGSDETLLSRLRSDVEAIARRPTITAALEERIASLAVDQLRREAHVREAAQRDAIEGIRARLSAVEAAPELEAALLDMVRAEVERAVRRATADAPPVAGHAGATVAGAGHPVSAAQWEHEHERLVARLDALTMRVERDAAAAVTDPVGQGPDAATQRELERQRMALERVGLHLGEHERALAEMSRHRDVAEQLDQLAARVDALASRPGAEGPVPSSSGDAPELHAELRALGRRLDTSVETLQADRQRLLNQLDRMASSIDWRLQRLEGSADSGT